MAVTAATDFIGLSQPEPSKRRFGSLSPTDDGCRGRNNSTPSCNQSSAIVKQIYVDITPPEGDSGRKALKVKT